MDKTLLEKQKEQVERLRKLLDVPTEEILRELSPDMRALYEKTVALQKKIGKGNGEFDVVKTIRKLRGYDD